MTLLSSKNLIILGIIAFLAVSFWSLSYMSMDMNGRMLNCPFIKNYSNFCQMDILNHISQWQQFFTMTREKSMLLSLFSLLVILYITVFTFTKGTYEKLKHKRFRNYFYWNNPEIKLFDYLALAFSDGIIHSKIYT